MVLWLRARINLLISSGLLGRNCQIWVLILLLGRIHLLDIFIVLDIIEVVCWPVLLEKVLVGNELCSLIRVGLNMTCIILDVAPDPVLIFNIKSGLVMNNPIIFIVLPILIIVVVSLLHLTGHLISRLLISIVGSIYDGRLIVSLAFGIIVAYLILPQYLLLESDDLRLSHTLEIWILPAPSIIYLIAELILVVLGFAGEPFEHLGYYGFSYFRITLFVNDLFLSCLQSSLTLLFLRENFLK